MSFAHFLTGSIYVSSVCLCMIYLFVYILSICLSVYHMYHLSFYNHHHVALIMERRGFFMYYRY